MRKNELPLGAVYGKWTVTGEGRLNKNKAWAYPCTCECGTKRVITSSSLVRGSTTQCKVCSNQQKSYARAKYEDTEHIIGNYLNRVELSAHSRNIVFSLTMQDLEDQWQRQDAKCALSGIELTLKTFSKNHAATASLDRIDSSQGYTVGNIQWLHKDINKMKLNHTEDYFLYMCNQITSYKQETVRLRGTRPWLK